MHLYLSLLAALSAGALASPTGSHSLVAKKLNDAIRVRSPDILSDLGNEFLTDVDDFENDVSQFENYQVDGCLVVKCALEIGVSAFPCVSPLLTGEFNSVNIVICIEHVNETLDGPEYSDFNADSRTRY